MQLQRVFVVEKADQLKKYEGYLKKSLNQNPNQLGSHDRMLLWHGSRLTNWVGILSEGLRIAPPIAPVTGYMFGKGVYYADIVSKRALYSRGGGWAAGVGGGGKKGETGLLLLEEVCVGSKPYDVFEADYHCNKSCAKNKSVATYAHGLRYPAKTEKIESVLKSSGSKCNTVSVPVGDLKTVGANDVYHKNDGTLQYNEYVIYDTAQRAPRFLCEYKYM